MRYWLLKSEPAVFSYDDLERLPARTTGWDGVRNYQARNMLRDEMQRRDRAFMYHSSCPEPGIAGIVEVVRAGYPDETAFAAGHPHYDPDSAPESPRWFQVDVRAVRRLARFVSLDDLRRAPELESMLVLRRGNRLSVTPLTRAEWQAVLRLERAARG